MGRAKELKKIRKYSRQNANRIFQQFEANFNIDEYLKPKPRFCPKFIWNFLLWIIVKKG